MAGLHRSRADRFARRPRRRGPQRRGIDEIFPAGLDGHAFDAAAWREAQDTQAGLRPGRVMVAPTAPADAAERHFTTAWPNYIQIN